MKKPTLYIKRNEFIQWYFDESTIDATIDLLIEKGKVSLNDLLQGLGYIPINLIDNQEDIKKRDLNENEILLPSKIYNLKLIK